jgi:hypothetical protein
VALLLFVVVPAVFFGIGALVVHFGEPDRPLPTDRPGAPPTGGSSCPQAPTGSYRHPQQSRPPRVGYTDAEIRRIQEWAERHGEEMRRIQDQASRPSVG